MVTPPRPARFVLSASGERRLHAWLLRHLQTFFYTLGLLARAPMTSLMTAAVIGMALALPAGLYVLLDNVQDATRGWDGGNEISLFLSADVADRDAEVMVGELHAWPELVGARLITRAQALEEFRTLSGFGEALGAFADDNPLPAVVVVTPSADAADVAAVDRLLARLAALPGVDYAQFDLAWLKRLYAILGIIERGTLVLASLLAVSVLLVVANTMRLGIENRRQEIEIAKLFGATDAFIRRPFLYSGLLYGALGGMIAWGLVWTCFMLLAEPAQRLTALYSGSYQLQALDATGSLGLLASGALLGLLGSWLSVARHLAAIEPS